MICVLETVLFVEPAQFGNKFDYIFIVCAFFGVFENISTTFSKT